MIGAALEKIGFKAPSRRQVGAMGSLEAADRDSVNFSAQVPYLQQPDVETLWQKSDIEGRAYHAILNDPIMRSALDLHRDGLVGSTFLLKATPRWRVIPGATEAWADEFSEEVEEKFGVWGDSPRKWVDASRRNTFTGLMRLAASMHLLTGEVIASAEWGSGKMTPFRTAIQMISPDRIRNPADQPINRKRVRGGVFLSAQNVPLGYYVHHGRYESLFPWGESSYWRSSYVRAEKPWGRKQILHYSEQWRPGQTRGISPAASALKTMWAAQRLREIILQAEIVKASFAAVIESPLPQEEAFRLIGADSQKSAQDGFASFLKNWMGWMDKYMDGARSLTMNGAKIAYTPPGTKLMLQSLQSGGSEGIPFAELLERITAMPIGVSAEQLGHSHKDSNYSSARASALETFKHLRSVKKAVIDPFASDIYRLWLEEAANNGDLETLRGMRIYDMDGNRGYLGLSFDALTDADWIASGRGQVDELKETQAAVLRIRAGLSSYSREVANLNGATFKREFTQIAKDLALAREAGIDLNGISGLESENKDGSHSEAAGGESDEKSERKESG